MESSRWSSSYHNKSTNTNGGGGGGGGDHLLLQLPESPREPMEFLSRSWSASAIKVCKAVAPPPPPAASTPASLLLPKSSFGNGNSGGGIAAIPEKNGNEEEEEEEEEAAKAKISGNTFTFASSATSQLVLERIMAQSEVSPLTSGRLSHSSGPLNASCLAEDTDSPLNLSPNDEFEDVVKYLRVNNSLQPLFTTKWNGYTASGANTPGTKTVGRWLKERREKKKEETRTQDAQVHAAVTVAGLASAVAAIASATAAASSTGKDKQMAKTDVAVASAATLVAAQCVEAAEAMGADREHLVSAISSAVNVHSHGDISTLTAAAATALRGVATLKARALKEVWNIATMIPVDKGLGGVPTGHAGGNECGPRGYVNSPALDDNFLGICNQELLGRGRELLKRTRNGDLHWKIVSVYIHRTGQVMLKMKSKHVGSTITKKKKNVVLKVCKDLPAWPGRHLFEDGEKRRYFGLQTDGRGLVEFECKNQKEYDIWTQGVSRLLSIVAERRQNNYKLK